MDRIADEARQQHAQIRQHIGQHQHLGPERLPARERQQLAHKRSGAVGVLLDVHDVREGRVGRPVVRKQKVGRHDDRGQHIVEVVRDAAGQLTDRLHFLALRHLRFQRLLLGRIHRIDDRRFLRRAVRAALPGDGVDENAQMPFLRSRLQHGIEGLDFRLTGAGRLERLVETILGIALEQRLEADMAFQRVRIGDPAEQRQERCIRAQDAPVLVERGNRHGRGVEEPREPDLGTAQVVRRLAGLPSG
jgi:hypothetical protein